MTKEIFYGIGVGPGDSGYLTKTAIDALAASQVVCVPKSKAERESVALQTAQPYLAAEVLIEELLFPMTRDTVVLAQHWREAASRVAQLLTEHSVVSFLTIGDPLLYSTFSYLLQFLRKLTPTVKTEIIPGISSINAAAALLQVPLLENDERMAVIPVPVGQEEFVELTRYVDTVVLLKVSAAYDETLALLEKTGFNQEVYLVSRVGGKDEFWTNDPFAYRGQAVDYLSLLIAKRRRNG
ncbi:MAG TPA: precorrin-2 C(20)-methyltransferase [Oscillospiraceae bacterium]|nr:precorrin-2 C(20)-methyltransferase [Oscillospiraceae bacterium]